MNICEYYDNELNIDIEKCLSNFCYKENENNIIINYEKFKKIACFSTYDFLINKIKKIFNNVLCEYDTLKVHIYIKGISLLDIDKHYNFISILSETLKREYPNKLEKCYIYDGNILFSTIFNLLSKLIDKDTINKISFIS